MEFDVFFMNTFRGQIKTEYLPFYYDFFSKAGYQTFVDQKNKRFDVFSVDEENTLILEVSSPDHAVNKEIEQMVSSRLQTINLCTLPSHLHSHRALRLVFNITVQPKPHAQLTYNKHSLKQLLHHKNNFGFDPLPFSIRRKWSWFFSAPEINIDISMNEAEGWEEVKKRIDQLSTYLQIGFLRIKDRKSKASSIPWGHLFQTPTIQPAARNSTQENTSKLSGELLFNYSIIYSAQESASLTTLPFMIMGSLTLKNNGSVPITHPKICLRMSPPEKILLQGKIISAERAKEMKSPDKNNYANAWTFIEEDAMQKGMKTGDYWLEPLQPMSIPPGAKTSLDFQLSFASPLEIGELLTSNGYITANQEQLKILSSNKIMISG